MEKIINLERLEHGVYRLTGIKEGKEEIMLSAFPKVCRELAEAEYIHNDKNAMDITNNGHLGDVKFEEFRNATGSYGGLYFQEEYIKDLMALEFPKDRNLTEEAQIKEKYFRVITPLQRAFDILVAWAAIFPGGDDHGKALDAISEACEYLECYIDGDFLKACKVA